jgi:hypothetical protein
MTPGAHGTKEREAWVRSECCRFYILAAAMQEPYVSVCRTNVAISRQYAPSEIDGYSADREIRMYTRSIHEPIGPQDPDTSGDWDADGAFEDLREDVQTAEEALDYYDASSPEYKELSIRMAPFDYNTILALMKARVHDRNFKPLMRQSWSHLYQILQGIPNIIPRAAYRQVRIDVLFPAEYPGSWIEAMRYYIQTSKPTVPAMLWLASSYTGKRGYKPVKPGKARKGSAPVGGTPDGTKSKDGIWLMLKDEHDGDLTKPDVRESIITETHRSTKSDRAIIRESYEQSRGKRMPDESGVDMYLADGDMDITDPVDLKRYNRESKAARAQASPADPRKPPGVLGARARRVRARGDAGAARAPVAVAPPRKLWSRREEINTELILGEMAISLRVLRKGGTAVIKAYTITTPDMVKGFLHWANHFRDVVTCKPAMSNGSNREVYLVGLGFLGKQPPPPGGALVRERSSRTPSPTVRGRSPRAPVTKESLYRSEFAVHGVRQMSVLRANTNRRQEVLGTNTTEGTHVLPDLDQRNEEFVYRMLGKSMGPQPPNPEPVVEAIIIPAVPEDDP